MGTYKENAKSTLVALLNNIQKEKTLKSIVIEDRVETIIENIIKEAEFRIIQKLKVK